jgi:hypothetical protein
VATSRITRPGSHIRNRFKGLIMNRTLLSALTLAVAALSAGQALADEPVGLTRAQVMAELAAARASGDLVGNGETGQKLNELFPGRYAKTVTEPGKTRDEVVSELAQARRNGDLLANGETGLKLNEQFPALYPAQPVAASKTREQVRQELAEAKRTGDILASGESSLKLNELYPNRYPSKAKGQQRAASSDHAAMSSSRDVVASNQ